MYKLDRVSGLRVNRPVSGLGDRWNRRRYICHVEAGPGGAGERRTRKRTITTSQILIMQALGGEARCRTNLTIQDC